ncbi:MULTISPECIES: hypothetical protein [Kaistia]|uniref:Uncharacterized protein n=1 Tax=Kaistia nematophila TaxID=2994654 RepID=A0A9X3E6W5_9HYPH|nr:hypothetical protein [Kaistia nematophila]MBN9058909.1 hypothetical protein [Hyphomicrobiales bacterium]MCX5572281.1 hypothetical protein [Kaistia nematophila]
MQHLRISPEGISSLFWIVPEDKPAYAIEPDDLDLSEELLDRIEVWNDVFDALFDSDDPKASQFPTPQAEAAWRAEGRALADAIREELGDEWEVEARF